MMIGFVIWSVVALIFVYIGISSRKEKKTVGFFTFTKPPIVEDVQSYNKAVANIWFVSAVIFELVGLPLMFLEQNSPLIILIILGVIVWVIGIIVAYLKIEAKYKVNV